MLWYKYAKKNYAEGQWWFCFICGLCTLIVTACGVSLSGCTGSNGHHAGYVTSVEDLHNVTWDSTVVHFKSNPESTQEDVYCVANNAVRQTLDEAARKRTRVLIHYHNDLPMWRWQCNGGDSIVDSVDLASPEGGN